MPRIRRKPMIRLSSISWLIVILSVHAVLAAVYWHYTPYEAPPDEKPHGHYVQVLAEKHRLPHFTGYEGDGYEAHQPPLYYAMGIPFLLAGRAIGMEQPAEMVRLLSLLLGGLSVIMVYFAVLTAFSGDRAMALMCSAFVALLPTHSMVSSSVSNEILVEVLFGLAFLLAADILINGSSWRKTVMLGLVVGAGLLTNAACLILFGVAFLTYVLVWRRGALSLRAATVHLLAVVTVGIIIGGWWLVRNQVLYGDPLASAKFRQVFSGLPGPHYFLDMGMPLYGYLYLFVEWTFESFWGRFGHMSVRMPNWSYVVLALVTIVVDAGFLAQLARRKLPLDRSVAIVYGFTLLAVVAAFVVFNTEWLQAQGRYLYPALVPISVFWVIGIGKFTRKSELTRALLVVSVPLFAQVVALATCIIPVMPDYFWPR